MALNFNGGSWISGTAGLTSAPPITVACWFFRDSSASIMMCAGVQGSSLGKFRCRLNAGTSTQFDCFNDAGTSASPTGPAIANSAWYHFAGVSSSNTSRYCYINGVPGSQNTTDISVTSTLTTAQIGAAVSAFSIDGSIAEFGIWNIALSTADILRLYNGFSPMKIRPESLVCYVPAYGDEITHVNYKGSAFTRTNTPVKFNHPRTYI